MVHKALACLHRRVDSRVVPLELLACRRHRARWGLRRPWAVRREPTLVLRPRAVEAPRSAPRLMRTEARRLRAVRRQ